MKKNGFTLIEILISLAIIAALAGIGIPAIYNNVMNIEQTSTVESAMNGLRQFFVDARSKSVNQEIKYELSKESDTSLKFTGSAGADDLHYTLPTGMRTTLTLATEPASGTFAYVLGLFLEEKDTYFEIEDDFKIILKLSNGETAGTLSIVQGLPVLEY